MVTQYMIHLLYSPCHLINCIILLLWQYEANVLRVAYTRENMDSFFINSHVIESLTSRDINMFSCSQRNADLKRQIVYIYT